MLLASLLMLVLFLIVSTISDILAVVGLPFAVDSVMFLLSLLLLASIHADGLPLCCWPPSMLLAASLFLQASLLLMASYCVVGPVGAFIPLRSCYYERS